MLVLSGKDKGKTGKVTQVFPESGKVVVEGVNILKKHLRARGRNQKGQRIELPAPLAVSKVMIFCGRCEKPARVSVKTGSDGRKARYCKKCKEAI